VTQVAIVTSDQRLQDMLQPSGLKVTRLDSAQFRALSGAQAPSAVVLDLRGETQLPLALATYRRQNPASSVVLVLSSLDPRLMLEAMRAGVTECVAEPLTASGLEEAVRRVLVDSHGTASGQLFAFVGAKGGIGTTTLAVNTAAALARVADGDVLLADLHLGHGDAAVFLGVDPRFSVVDALENVHRLDDALLKSLVEDTKHGLHLLASSDRTLVSAFDPQRTRALLEFAVRRYRVVVVDVPRSDMSMLDALDMATSIVVVASQEVGALKNAARMAQTLSDRYGGSRVRVIVNRFDARSDIGQSEVERAVGLPVAHMIPSDYRTAVEAVNTGRPVVMEKEQGLARALRGFAGDLAGIVKKHRETPIGVFGRLAWRRA
jgi:pilus assembly protein CpaE